MSVLIPDAVDAVFAPRGVHDGGHRASPVVEVGYVHIVLDVVVVY